MIGIGYTRALIVSGVVLGMLGLLEPDPIGAVIIEEYFFVPDLVSNV